MSTIVKVRDLLRGCTPGRLQSVGNMQVVPLCSDLEDERFVPPTEALVSTAGYGTLVVRNPSSGPLLVPSCATYIVPQAAQNHALPHAGFVKAAETKQYATAMCVQQSQGGYISEGHHELMLLPFPLREQAHRLRRETSFNRLWQAIADFNRDAGLPADNHQGHLEYFFNHYKVELDTFVAQFEPVPDQVGAIVLIDGRVAGIERTPSAAYFRGVWKALIRECYGSLALLEAKQKADNKPPATRVPLRQASSVSDLLAALREADAQERAAVVELVNGVLDVELARSVDEEGELVVEALGEQPFVGQMIRDGEKIVYASLVATRQARASQQWQQAEPFSMQ
jgi:hypothetical protein